MELLLTVLAYNYNKWKVLMKPITIFERVQGNLRQYIGRILSLQNPKVIHFSQVSYFLLTLFPRSLHAENVRCFHLTFTFYILVCLESSIWLLDLLGGKNLTPDMYSLKRRTMFSSMAGHPVSVLKCTYSLFIHSFSKFIYQ